MNQVKQINRAAARRQSGASLMEAMIFLVIGALVVAAVVGMGVKVFGANNEKRTNEQVVEISTGIRNLFAGQAAFGVANANLLSSLFTANLLPSDVPTTGAGAAMTANNVYGGAMTVAVGAATNRYVIGIASVDDDVCIKLASKTQPGWVSVAINGGVAITALPVPVATAGAQCIAGAGANNVIWTGR